MNRYALRIPQIKTNIETLGQYDHKKDKRNGFLRNIFAVGEGGNPQGRHQRRQKLFHEQSTHSLRTKTETIASSSWETEASIASSPTILRLTL